MSPELEQRSLADLLCDPPNGFAVVSHGDFCATVTYKLPARGCWIAAILVFGCIWLIGMGGFALAGIFTASGALKSFPLLGAAFFALGLIALTHSVRSAFQETAFAIQVDELVITQGRKRSRLLRGDVGRVSQVLYVRYYMSGSVPVNTPMPTRYWTVEVEGRNTIRAFWSNQERKAEWLGNLIAGWARVDLERRTAGPFGCGAGLQ